MYNLVSRITDGLGELKKLLETHIHNQGLAAIEKCGDSALNVRQQSPNETKILDDFCMTLLTKAWSVWQHMKICIFDSSGFVLKQDALGQVSK